MAAATETTTTSGDSNAAATLMTPSFDLETYIGRYNAASETRLQRLLFIGEKAPDPEVSKLAYEMAERQMKATGNLRRYKEVFGPVDNGAAAHSRRPSHIVYDADWVAETEAATQSHLEVLTGRLSAAQSHLNKEAIRTAYLALGDFDRRRGELRDALRSVLRSRDYCTNRGQTGNVCLLVMEMAIDFRNYSQVRDYVAKAEHTSIPGDANFPSKLRIASGLVCLAEHRYLEAAQKFTSISGPPPDDFDSVMSAEDVALYGALLALATLDRGELCRMLEPPTSSDNVSTTNVGRMLAAGLELVPPVRDALRHFARAEYKSCLAVLESFKPQLELDLHLSSHVTNLFQLIRDKCLVEYLRPYRRIRLDSMASDFGLSAEELKSILAALIGNGQIANARIDCRTLTLTRECDYEEVEKQRAVRQRVAQLRDGFLNDAHAMIIRLACLEQDMVVQSDRKGGDSSGSSSYWNVRPGMENAGFEETYDGDESSDDADTPMVDLAGDDDIMVNPEDLY